MEGAKAAHSESWSFTENFYGRIFNFYRHFLGLLGVGEQKLKRWWR